MKKNYFFAPVFKKIGWAMFVPSVILTCMGICDVDCFSNFCSCDVFTIIPMSGDDICAAKSAAGSELTFLAYNDTWMDEITWVLSMLSVLFIGFASEKEEDECTLEIRMKSLMWAVKVYACFFIAGVLLIYGSSFMVFISIQHFALFLLFIAKFYFELYKFRKEVGNEE